MRKAAVVTNLALALVLVLAIAAGAQETAEPVNLPASGPVTVVAVGDLGAGDLDRANQNKLDDQVAALAKVHRPDAIIGLGDLNQGLGCYSAYTSPGGFSGAWGAAGLKYKFLPVPGNHDWATAAGQSTVLDDDPDTEGLRCSQRKEGAGYFRFFADPTDPAAAPDGGAGVPGKGYWARRLGDWMLISINSNCNPGAVSSNNHVQNSPGCARYDEQINFLRGVLQAKQTKCQAVLLHHPLFSSAAPFYSNAAAPGNLAYQWQQWVAKVTQANGGDLFISGHNHAYERIKPIDAYTGKVNYKKGVRQFVVGTGGFGRDNGASSYPYTRLFPGSAYRIEMLFGITKFAFFAGGWRSAFYGLDGKQYDPASAGCR